MRFLPNLLTDSMSDVHNSVYGILSIFNFVRQKIKKTKEEGHE